MDTLSREYSRIDRSALKSVMTYTFVLFVAGLFLDFSYGNSTPLSIVFPLLGCIAVLRIMTPGFKLTITPPTLLFFAFTLFAMLFRPPHPFDSQYLDVVMGYGRFCIILLLTEILFSSQSPRLMRRFFRIVVAFTTISVLVGFMQSMFGWPFMPGTPPRSIDKIGSIYRACGFTIDPNYFAANLLLTFPLHRFLRRKPLKVVYIGLIIAGILLSMSRAAGICLAAVMVVDFIFFSGSSKIKNFVLVSVASVPFLLLFIWFILTNERYFSLVNSVYSGTIYDDSLSERSRLLAGGLELIQNNPLLGYGTGSFFDLSQTFLHSKKTYAHNNYVTLIVEYGVIGSLIYFISLLYFFFQFKKKRSPANVVLFSFLLLSFFLTFLRYNLFWVLLIAFARFPASNSHNRAEHLFPR